MGEEDSRFGLRFDPIRLDSRPIRGPHQIGVREQRIQPNLDPLLGADQDLWLLVRTAFIPIRYSGQFLTIKSVLDNGLLGRVHYGEVDYYHGVGPWYGQYRWNVKKKGGGSSLLSAGCHALDALLLCMGGEVETVTSLNTRSSHKYFKAYEYPTTTTSPMTATFAGNSTAR